MFPVIDMNDALPLVEHDQTCADGLAKIAEAVGDLEIPTGLEELPDRCFALIFEKAAGRERRYPVHSPDSARLALAEFDAFGRHVGPEKTAQVAGANVINACDRFGVSVPDHLVEYRDPQIETNVSQPPRPPAVKQAAEEGPFALEIEGQGRYPLRSADEVKQAIDYFGEWYRDIPPALRHPYAAKVAAQARTFGVPVPLTITAWETHAYSPYLTPSMASRVSLASSDAHRQDLLELCEKKASLDPEDFAQGLYRVDCRHGATEQWGHEYPDPWETAFLGASVINKEASAPEGDATALWRLAARGDLGQVLSPELVEKFAQDPEAVASQLDDVARSVLASLG